VVLGRRHGPPSYRRQEERFVEVAPWAADDEFPALARGLVYGTLLSIAFWLVIAALVYRTVL
jgi:hypothetical protein